MSFRPGELDQRIIIERSASVSDGMGGNTITWSEHLVLWSLVRPLSGNEKVDFERVQGEARYLFVVRYPVDILDDDRISWEGDFYNIRVRKSPKGRDLYMQIDAERGVAQ
jgi:SPP1 family predicted phage head-tail adaptor